MAAKKFNLCGHLRFFYSAIFALTRLVFVFDQDHSVTMLAMCALYSFQRSVCLHSVSIGVFGY